MKGGAYTRSAALTEGGAGEWVLAQAYSPTASGAYSTEAPISSI
jgi:hypothetical protein